jgi:hypothetical protein
MLSQFARRRTENYVFVMNLLARADAIAPNRTADFKSSLTAFCSRVSALHVVADLNQQASSEAELAKVLESFSRVKAYFSKEVIAQAHLYLETFTCNAPGTRR